MSGSAVNRGGVRLEFLVVDDPKWSWRASMRGHEGRGESIGEAVAALIESIEKELATAKAAAKTAGVIR